jgi:AcrR family transcriptional regulator
MTAPKLVGDKRARTRDQLLVAAQELLFEQNAASLGIRQIATQAGLVHGSFYNYYPGVEALMADLADLFFLSHALAVAQLRNGARDPAALFARVTRQTLRFIPASPALGRMLFDAGLPVDRFVSGLRAAMRADIVEGVARRVFRIDDIDLTVSMIAGSVLGLSLDLHRGVLKPTSIDAATVRLLEMLGLTRADARAASVAELAFLPPPALPLRWLALDIKAPELTHAA